MHEVRDVTFDGLRARIVLPADANGAGILQIPAWQGFVDIIDEYAGWMADAGFTVLSWDPFSAYPADLTTEEKRRITSGEILDADARAEHVHCVDYLTQELGCGGIGTIGYCMGGRMCLLVGAADPRVKASSGYYPSLHDHTREWQIDLCSEAPEIGAAIQIHYPRLDIVTPYDRIKQASLALEARPDSATTITSVYAGAHHGFLRGREEADRHAARIAWPATIAFFRALLLPS